MKRKLTTIIMLILMVLSLSSCSLILDLITGGGNPLSYSYTESDENTLRSNMAKTEEAIANGSDFKTIDRYLKPIMVDYVYLATYSSEAYIKYCDTNSELYKSDYSYFVGLAQEIQEWRIKQFKLIFATENKEALKNAYFTGYTDEEIDDFLEEKPANYYEIQKNKDDVIFDFNNLKEKNLETVTPLYDKVIKYDNELANLMGYKSFIDYANSEEYGRAYDEKKAVEFTENVKKYLVNLYVELSKDVTLLTDDKTSDEYREYYRFNRGAYTEYYSIMKEYTSAVSSSFGQALIKAVTKNALFGQNEASYQGAFTTYLYAKMTPYMYFGPGYQNANTIIHEFGHYYSALINQTQTGDFDLAETQSQGNEMIFLAYLNNTDYFVKKVNQNAEDLIVKAAILDVLQSIIQCSMIFEFENYCHNAYRDEVIITDFDLVYKNICNEYGGYDVLKECFGYAPERYWQVVTTAHAGYYISYAVSAVPALLLYANGVNDISKSIRYYLDLAKETNLSFEERIVDVGLYSPFSEDAFKQISEIF